MITLIFALMFLQPKPAELDIRLDASPYTVCQMKVGEMKVVPGILRTEPLLVPMQVEIEIIWLNGETVRNQFVTVEAIPGIRAQYTFEIPKVFPLRKVL